MTPLQSIAMGLVVVLVHAPFGGYDAVADPAGWLLVLLGLIRLRPRLAGAGVLVGVALLSLAVSTATYLPQVREQLTDSGGWALSLPQLAFGYLLCTALAPHAGPFSRRLLTLRWLFVALGLAPVVVLGGGLTGLTGWLAAAGVLTTGYLVYLLFRLPEPAGRRTLAVT